MFDDGCWCHSHSVIIKVKVLFILFSIIDAYKRSSNRGIQTVKVIVYEFWWNLLVYGNESLKEIYEEILEKYWIFKK